MITSNTFRPETLKAKLCYLYNLTTKLIIWIRPSVTILKNLIFLYIKIDQAITNFFSKTY